MNIETKEPAPSADKIERKVFTDPETGIEQIELEKNGETSEIFLRAPDGKIFILEWPEPPPAPSPGP